MLHLAILAACVVAVVAYLLLSEGHWRKLLGVALLGDALALVAIAVGGVSARSLTVAVCLVLIAFALFLSAASFERGRRAVREAGAPPDEPRST